MSHIISGKVIHGDGYGKKIGFPTVNLHVDNIEALPSGVFSGTALIDNIEYRAGIVLGPKDKIEAHLLGYDGDAYGKVVTLQIKEFLREYKNYNNEQELINQIKEDLKQC
ncbi:MAG: riboflavin kinase [Candidatus Paceibacterota bacterium]|jgi:FAD synthase